MSENTLPHACFSAHSQWDAHILYFHSTSFVQQVCKRKVVEHSCSTVWCAFHICATAHALLYLAHLRFASRHRSLVGSLIRYSTLLVETLPITLNIKVDLRMCFTQTSVINLALLSEQHSPQVVSPATSYFKVTQSSFLMRTERMKI